MCTRARSCGWQVGGVDVAIGPFLRNTIHAAPFFPSSTPTTVYVAAPGSNALEICGLTVDGRPPDDSYPGGVCSGACLPMWLDTPLHTGEGAYDGVQAHTSYTFTLSPPPSTPPAPPSAPASLTLDELCTKRVTEAQSHARASTPRARAPRVLRAPLREVVLPLPPSNR